jgi:hypothetical protein
MGAVRGRRVYGFEMTCRTLAADGKAVTSACVAALRFARK